MNRVGSIAELCKEKYTEGLMFAARNLLSNGYSLEFVCESITLPPEKVKELEEEIKASD